MIQFSKTDAKEVLVAEIEALPETQNDVEPWLSRPVKDLAIKMIQARPEDKICVHVTIGSIPTIKSAQVGIQVTGR